MSTILRPVPLAAVVAVALLLTPGFVQAAMFLRPVDATETDAQRQIARDVYGSEHATVAAAETTYFSQAFPSHKLYFATTYEKAFPLHHAYAMSSSGAARDVTQDFNLLMADLGTIGSVISDASRALLLAKAYVEAAQVEFAHDRYILDSSMASDFGVAIADPAAASIVGGWRVTMTTWERTNGVLSDWTITFGTNRIQKAAWDVRTTGIGPYEPDPHGLLHLTNHLVEATYGSAGGATIQTYYVTPTGTRQPVDNVLDTPHISVGAAKVESDEAPMEAKMDTSSSCGDTATGYSAISCSTNDDGSRWQVLLPSDVTLTTDLQALAEALAQAGRMTYNTHVKENTRMDCAGSDSTYTKVNSSLGNWGFESRDPDCKLQIFLAHPNALAQCANFAQTADDSAIEGSGVTRGDTVIYIHPRIRECVARYDSDTSTPGVGLYTPSTHTLFDLALVAVGHEHFHYVQFVATGEENFAGQGIGWDTWFEGQAVWSVTKLVPEVEGQPDTFWQLFGNKFQERTYYGMCQHSSNVGANVPSPTNPSFDEWFITWLNSPHDQKSQLPPRPEHNGYNFAPFWGRFYASTSNSTDSAGAQMHSTHELLHQLETLSQNAQRSQSCALELPGVLEQALLPWGTSLDELYGEFLASAAGRSYEWDGVRWGDRLHEPFPRKTLQVGEDDDWDVADWSLTFIRVSTLAQSHAMECQVSAPDWRFGVFHLHDAQPPRAGAAPQTCAPAETFTISSAADERTLFGAARTSSDGPSAANVRLAYE